ncbi:amidohydrolase family protein [Pseudoalteromonas sp. MMG013]|uniref:Xaa-Pro dipeptidase n=1 Tax=Pseudoalteromonas sp. MMG013 TaxID=2822687 RepID=UPI001B39BB1C|nr:amidohydrolase family protein [Pseudoalteromonas sp. MMG013]MBQ4861627.1 amidohydrolase family protein [Pseudoalteromonas sp. MMG013]
MKSTYAILACALAYASSAYAQTTLLTAKAYLDVHTGQLINNPTLLIKDDKIVRITTNGQLRPPKGALTINLPNKILLPGLMDMHVHLTSDAADNFLASRNYSIPRQTVKAVKNAKTTLLAGFTTVRNLGASGYSVIATRDGINAKEIPGPRIFSAGHSISITGGHCDDNFSAPEKKSLSAGVADGPWAVRAKVRENIKYGANTIKICATGGVFSKGTKVGVQQFSEQELKAAADEAHLRGLVIAAHAHGTSGIKAAIRAGIDSIEHCSFMDKEAIQLALKHGTYLSCDIYNTEYTLAFGEANGVPQENINKEKLVSKAQRESFTKAVNAGVKMVFGSDAAIYPHGDNAKQFSRMVKFGMTPLQAIQSSTIHSAALLKLNNVGQIKADFIADIIAVDDNPLRDISTLENVRFVMKEGTVFKH